MPRLYFSSDSYPELRDVSSPWQRAGIWWRAFRHALGHADFWVFAAGQVIVFLVMGVVGTVLAMTTGWRPWLGVAVVVAFLVFAYFQVSWGGDVMRRHLREVSEIARHACPRCGHSLRGHRGEEPASIICPECGLIVEAAVFERPYRLPREVLALPLLTSRVSGGRETIDTPR